MEFFKNMTSPTPKLTVPRALWLELTMHLEKTSDDRRESGAFLLGNVTTTGSRHASSFVPYEDLDPTSLHRAAVRMTSAAFSRLFSICEHRGQQVVADIHAHPAGAGQSPSDRANPMLPVAGHVALIVPNYAKCPVALHEMSFNIYEGPGKWISARGRHVHTHLEILE